MGVGVKTTLCVFCLSDHFGANMLISLVQHLVLGLASWPAVSGRPLSVSISLTADPCWYLFIVAETTGRGQSISMDVIASEHRG